MTTEKYDFNEDFAIRQNFEDLALAVLGNGVKSEGVKYLLSRDGRFWTEVLEATPFTLKRLSKYFRSEAPKNDQVVYRLQRPKACPNCDSKNISIGFEEDYQMRDSFWKCECGWEDARSTVYRHRQRMAA